MKIVNTIFYILTGILFWFAGFDVSSFIFLMLSPIFIIRGIIEIFSKN